MISKDLNSLGHRASSLATLLLLLTVCFLCITTITECYDIDSVFLLFFCLLYFFYAYNQNYENAIEPFLFTFLVIDYIYGLAFC